MTKGINPLTGRHYRFKDRSGSRNGRLTIIKEVGISGCNKIIWQAMCDCGNLTHTTRPTITRSSGSIMRQQMQRLGSSSRQENPVSRTPEYRSRLRKRLRESPQKLVAERISRMMCHALSGIGELKGGRTFEILGYTPGQLKEHIERQFLHGMGWHNRSEWEIDHIRPISLAKDRYDVIELNQLYNLRPLWARDNNKKKNRLEFLI